MSHTSSSTKSEDYYPYYSVHSTTHSISPVRRWVIYAIGVIETFLFGGCIFGWASFVYILKNEGIFSDLCSNVTTTTTTTTDSIFQDQDSHLGNITQDTLRAEGCEEQDKVYALIYTIGSFAYTIPSVFIGLLLHHFGLAISRIIAALLTCMGFIALGCTTKDSTSWLYVSVILLALGGNLLRMSGLQFCNLFPNYRSTALTIISGSFAASAGLFMFVQIGQQRGLSIWSMSIFLAAIAFLSLPATIIMPWYQIPYSGSEETSSVLPEIPLRESLFSVSIFTYFCWYFLTMFSVRFFSMYFNTWITKISQTNEEAGMYSFYFSLTSFICPLISFIPGLITDYLSKRPLKDSSPEARAKNELRSPVAGILLVTMAAAALQSCFLFNSIIAICWSLVIITFLRPSAVSMANAFTRIRFPASHFNRLVGVVESFIAVFSVSLYPFFIWSQNSLTTAIIVFIVLLCLTLVHPLHLLSDVYFRRISVTMLLEYRKEKYTPSEE